MEFGKEIKQKKFVSERLKAMINVIYTGNFLNAMSIRSLKPYGLSPQQYNVLRILRGQYPTPVSLGLIQDRMLDKMSNASRLVDKLKQKELVDRQACSEDRRQLDIVINKKGLALLEELDPIMMDQDTQLGKLTEKEAKLLNELLDKIRD